MMVQKPVKNVFIFKPSNSGIFTDSVCGLISTVLSKNHFPFNGNNNLSFFLSLYTALPPLEDYVQMDCVLLPWYKVYGKRK